MKRKHLKYIISGHKHQVWYKANFILYIIIIWPCQKCRTVRVYAYSVPYHHENNISYFLKNHGIDRTVWTVAISTGIYFIASCHRVKNIDLYLFLSVRRPNFMATFHLSARSVLSVSLGLVISTIHLTMGRNHALGC